MNQAAIVANTPSNEKIIAAGAGVYFFEHKFVTQMQNLQIKFQHTK